MEIRNNGNRFYNYSEWGYIVHPAYDYERCGLLKHLMPKFVIDAVIDDNGKWKKTALGTILDFVERSFVMLMKYTERLKNFKNYAYMNR